MNTNIAGDIGVEALRSRKPTKFTWPESSFVWRLESPTGTFEPSADEYLHSSLRELKHRVSEAF
jgi:hypothetical protein